MRIDGTHISTYGLMLSEVNGFFSQPSRKKTTDEFDPTSIILNDRVFSVVLVGRFSSYLTAKAGIDGLTEKIKSVFHHTFVFVKDNETVTGIIKDGVSVEEEKGDVRIEFKITKV